MGGPWGVVRSGLGGRSGGFRGFGGVETGDNVELGGWWYWEVGEEVERCRMIGDRL